MMTPRLRKISLTIHVSVSVGWLGAVAGFLALAIAGLTNRDPLIVQAADLAMALIAWQVIVPLSLAALLTGLAQSLGTKWGLFRHYWVVIKLLITLFATAILLLHMQPTSRLAEAAARASLSGTDLRALRLQLTADAAAAALVLLVAATLAVVKPPGLTRYGAHRQQRARR
jgi:hypothetical protein